MASASCCSFLKLGQPAKWFRGYIVFGNSVKGNVYLLLWKSCFSETSSSCGQKCVCETGLFGQHMAVNLCLSLSLSLAHLIFVGMLVFVSIVWACFLCMFLYILIIYIYIYVLSIKYLNSYIDISISYWYSNRTYSLYQSQLLSIIVATPSFFAEPENLRKTISCLYTRLCSQ